MPVSHPLKTLLVHIPKTAGEAMEKKLGMYGPGEDAEKRLWGVRGGLVYQHLSAMQIRDQYLGQDLFDQYYKFAFVRNPWDKAVSEYHWYLRFGEKLSFRDWVRRLYKNLADGPSHVLEVGHNIPQTAYVTDAEGHCLVDFVGRFENLEQDFAHVCHQLGLSDTGLPYYADTAAQGRQAYADYYDDVSQRDIADLYAHDIEYFGYQFE